MKNNELEKKKHSPAEWQRLISELPFRETVTTEIIERYYIYFYRIGPGERFHVGGVIPTAYEDQAIHITIGLVDFDNNQNLWRSIVYLPDKLTREELIGFKTRAAAIDWVVTKFTARLFDNYYPALEQLAWV